MLGIVLAGGTGSRLYPLTKVINKHLLPVYNKSLIEYPIELLVKSGIREIIIVTNTEIHASEISEYLDAEFVSGIDSIKYVYQNQPLGTAHAISLCQELVASEPFMVVFGDNIVEYNLMSSVEEYIGGAKVFVKQLLETKHFGRVVIERNQVIDILPADVPSTGPGYALSGIFFFDELIFSYIDRLSKNSKYELDIVDALKHYLRDELLAAEELPGYWLDAASSHEHLLEAACIVKNKGANKPLMTMAHTTL